MADSSRRRTFFQSMHTIWIGVRTMPTNRLALASVAILLGTAPLGFSQSGPNSPSTPSPTPFSYSLSYTFPFPFPTSLFGTTVIYTGTSPQFGPCQESVFLSQTQTGSGTAVINFAAGSLAITGAGGGTSSFNGTETTVTSLGTITGGSGIFTNATGTVVGTALLCDDSCPVATTYADTTSYSGTIVLSDGAGLTVLPSSLQVQTPLGTPASASIALSNQGVTGATYQASGSVTGPESNWLSVSPSDGMLAPATSTSLQVIANPIGLTKGVYQGQINLNINGAATAVPVTMLVGNQGGNLLLSETGELFQATVGGGPPAAQTLAVLNTGIGGLTGLTAVTSVTGSGPNWLNASIATGFASQTQTAVTVTVNPGSLRPGTYYGQIALNLPGATNSPQSVTVQMQVLAGALPTLAPAQINFKIPGSYIDPTSEPLGPLPPAVNITVTNPGLAALSYTITPDSPNFPAPGAWFTITPASGSIPAGGTAVLVVAIAPNCLSNNACIASMGPGFAQVLLNFPEINYDALGVFANLIFIGTNPGTPIPSWGAPPPGAPVVGAASPAQAQMTRAAGVHALTSSSTPAGCIPSVLNGTVTSIPVIGFQTTVGQPTPLEVTVFDNCGNNLDSGAVAASFSNGDPSVPLSPLGAGQWSATWVPSNAAASAGITLQGVSESGLSGGGTWVGPVIASTATPIVSNGGIVNAASGAPVIAPGAFISIYGENLAGGTAVDSATPFPNSLGSTQVFLGGESLPLYFTAGKQIDAIVPYDIAPDSSQALVVQTGNALSTPVPVTVATAAPGVFTQNQSGSGPGAILGQPPGGVGALNTASNPATAGDALLIFCTGLGPVTPAVPAGTPASLSTLSHTDNPVTVTIGGQNAQVLFAGLAPGYVGLYQVNVIVPAGIPASSAVPVILTVAGASSAPVTVAIH